MSDDLRAKLKAKLDALASTRQTKNPDKPKKERAPKKPAKQSASVKKEAVKTKQESSAQSTDPSVTSSNKRKRDQSSESTDEPAAKQSKQNNKQPLKQAPSIKQLTKQSNKQIGKQSTPLKQITPAKQPIKQLPSAQEKALSSAFATLKAAQSINQSSQQAELDESDSDEDLLGDIQFNTILGIETDRKEHGSHTKIFAEQTKSKKLSDAQMLKKVEAFDAKIAELRETDKEAAEALLKQRAFTHAMLRATGQTVKDSAVMLKKSIKKTKKSKEKSALEWSKRIHEQKMGKKERIDSKSANRKKKEDKSKERAVAKRRKGRDMSITSAD